MLQLPWRAVPKAASHLGNSSHSASRPKEHQGSHSSSSLPLVHFCIDSEHGETLSTADVRPFLTVNLHRRRSATRRLPCSLPFYHHHLPTSPAPTSRSFSLTLLSYLSQPRPRSPFPLPPTPTASATQSSTRFARSSRTFARELMLVV